MTQCLKTLRHFYFARLQMVFARLQICFARLQMVFARLQMRFAHLQIVFARLQNFFCNKKTPTVRANCIRPNCMKYEIGYKTDKRN